MTSSNLLDPSVAHFNLAGMKCLNGLNPTLSLNELLDTFTVWSRVVLHGTDTVWLDLCSVEFGEEFVQLATQHLNEVIAEHNDEVTGAHRTDPRRWRDFIDLHLVPWYPMPSPTYVMHYRSLNVALHFDLYRSYTKVLTVEHESKDGKKSKVTTRHNRKGQVRPLLNDDGTYNPVHGTEVIVRRLSRVMLIGPSGWQYKYMPRDAFNAIRTPYAGEYGHPGMGPRMNLSSILEQETIYEPT